jgi:hypothetical protein
VLVSKKNSHRGGHCGHNGHGGKEGEVKKLEGRLAGQLQSSN